MTRSTIRQWLICVALIAGFAACREEREEVVDPSRPVPSSSSPGRDAQDAARQSHERMLAALRDIVVRTDREHVFLGEQRAREAAERLQQAGAAATWQHWFEAGLARLQYGDLREGAAILEQAGQKLADGSLAGDAAAKNAVAFYLGVGWMRLGETENCCALPVPDSCILPLRGGALHQRREGSERAVACFQEVLERTVDGAYWHLAAQWLFNLAHMTLGNWPDGVDERFRLPANTFAAERDFPKFANIAAELGLDTFGLSGGALVDDFDGDQLLDVVASNWDTLGQLRLFHNNGDGTFTERSGAAGLAGIFGGLNLVQADYDNDGDLDILVLRGAWLFEHGTFPNSLLRNNGDGTFTDVTFLAGLGDVHCPTQTAAFADYDLDGDLDLYIGNETSQRATFPSQLFRNNGDGTFTDVAAHAGVTNLRYAKAVTWGDYDGDRWPDLYVSNIGGDNRLYRNRGDGTFVDVAPELRLTGPQQSFPAWFWDFDNDGALDLFVAAYGTSIAHITAFHRGLGAGPEMAQHELMRLYRGDGQGRFTEVGRSMGLTYPAMPMGSSFGDLDHDGFLDFYLGTGDPHYYSLMPNLMFVNDRGRGFRQVTIAGGFGHLQKGHGVSFADLDHDGDQDVFAVMGGAYRGDGARDLLFENPGFGNHWLTVQLVGVQSNRCAIGSRIRVDIVEDGAVRSVYRHVNSGGSFGGNPLRQTLGLGKATAIDKLEVFWPRTGKTQVLRDVPLDRGIRIVEDQPLFTELALPVLRFGKR